MQHFSSSAAISRCCLWHRKHATVFASYYVPDKWRSIALSVRRDSTKCIPLGRVAARFNSSVTNPKSRQSNAWKRPSRNTVDTSQSQHKADDVSSTASTIHTDVFVDLPALDKKWQNVWRYAPRQPVKPLKEQFGGKETRSKAYILPMFPYPSGNLHMGHLRVYTIADVLARWKRMAGFDVLNPMGWDAFGLPAENAAIERGVSPAAWTKENIRKMKELLKAMNTSIQWERELSTCDPGFYKHTQKLFLLLFQHGQAYQAEGLVNWDPVDKTVLANEQVDKDGNSWRSGAKVEKKTLKQWFLKVTAFQDALLQDLDTLSETKNWPERVLAMQRNWIGRSRGANIKFMLLDEDKSPLDSTPIEVFTTRPDTLLGVQFLAVSTSHPLVLNQMEHDDSLRNFVKNCSSLPDDSKRGYRLKGVSAVNPAILLSGAPERLTYSVPVYVTPYVLEKYGEGAVMGVPGHDERDYLFWTENNQDEEIRTVVRPHSHDMSQTSHTTPYTGPGLLTQDCGDFKNLHSSEAATKFIQELAKSGVAREAESWRLRDWLISRQRYWGTPIPIIHCQSCGTVPVPDDQLPVELPQLTGEWFKGKAGNPLEKADDWRNTSCPSCHRPALRDTDTMDTFVDSSWYFMRFPDSQNSERLFSLETANKMLPVDIYIGGIEHAILHLLYARYVAKFLANIGLWPNGNDPLIKGEPFKKLISQGMVHGKTFKDPDTGRYLRPEEVDISSPSEPKITRSGLSPNVTFEKMSKSKYNGIDPTMCVRKYGADVVRAHVLFAAPVIDVLDWDETKITGAQRWLGRIWRHVKQIQKRLAHSGADSQSQLVDTSLVMETLSKEEKSAWTKVQRRLGKISEAYETTSLNTLVSDLMKLTQDIIQVDALGLHLKWHQTSVLLRALAPVAPAFAEECWELLHHPDVDKTDKTAVQSIFDEPFPKPDENVQIDQVAQRCAVQENGKLRFTVEIPIMPEETKTTPGDWVLEKLRQTDTGRVWLEKHSDKKWKKVIVIRAGKTVNFVG